MRSCFVLLAMIFLLIAILMMSCSRRTYVIQAMDGQVYVADRITTKNSKCIYFDWKNKHYVVCGGYKLIKGRN